MNRLSAADRTSILGMLVKGESLRATSRLANVSINTVSKLIVDIGSACAEYHFKNVRSVRVRRLQCEEIWSFASGTQKHVRSGRSTRRSADTWTWVAMDADSKLVVSYLIGGRDGWWAREFLNDCASRVKGSIQVLADGNGVSFDLAKDAFAVDEDYKKLNRIYGASDEPDGIYDADNKAVQEFSARVGLSRFTRPTNSLGKKIENYAAVVAIHFLYYNFSRVHKSLGMTPAMAVGLSNHVWDLKEIVPLAN